MLVAVVSWSIVALVAVVLIVGIWRQIEREDRYWAMPGRLEAMKRRSVGEAVDDDTLYPPPPTGPGIPLGP